MSYNSQDCYYVFVGFPYQIHFSAMGFPNTKTSLRWNNHKKKLFQLNYLTLNLLAVFFFKDVNYWLIYISKKSTITFLSNILPKHCMLALTLQTSILGKRSWSVIFSSVGVYKLNFIF